MANNVRIEVNRKAVAGFLKGPATTAMLLELAAPIAARAGPGMVVTSRVGRTRSRVSIVTDTPEAKKAEAEHRRLSTALGA